MERALFLMIPVLWGGLVLGLGYFAHWNRKREMRRELESLSVTTQKESF
jgi:uncharacterized protein YjiS (DUF1127 family)